MDLPLLGLRTVIYPSVDLEKDTRWWIEVLGIEPYFNQPFYVGFSVAGYELGLLPGADPKDGALSYWGVDDVAAAVDAMVSAGSNIHTPIADVGEGIITATVLAPTGSIIGLIHNPHFVLE